MAEPTGEPPQFRSLGVLKLFFGQHAQPHELAELARAQVAMHHRHLEIVAGIIQRLQARGDRPSQLALAEMMADAHRALAGNWERIEQTVTEQPWPAAAGGTG